MKLFTLTLGLLIASTPLLADDGQRLVRSVSSSPGTIENPEPEGEHAFIKLMNFQVPTQRADGTLEPVDYYNIDDELVKTEDRAKPLISVYVYGPVISFDDFSQSGFPGHGRRDAFGAISLDDGETWKITNLSNSANESSFEVATPLPDPGLPIGETVTSDCVEGDTLCLLEASWTELTGSSDELYVLGSSTTSQDQIQIVNGITGDHVTYIRSKSDGTIVTTQPRLIPDEEAPCTIQAVFGEEVSNIIAVADAPETCVGPDEGEVTLITEYPGDVTNIYHAVASNRVLVAWQSKFCASGFPGYTGGSAGDAEAVADYLGIDNDIDMYLTDLFGVAGSQESTDYREQEEFPGEYDDVGEVPFSCLWSARGILRENPEATGTTEMVWFQAERLTSGRRDVNRIETSCVAGAGCAISWQEDPDGLRPGEGEGAGTGWAGATTNSQTDIWYSFIEWEDMDIVDIDGTPAPLADNSLDSGRPQPYVPMMVPARLTNNARCLTDTTEGYCASEVATAYGLKDQCVGTIDIPLGPQGDLRPVCVVDVNESGAVDAGDLPNVANTAASRPRLNLQPRDTDGDEVTDDAWVIIIHEEDKGLGRYGFLNDVAWDGNLENTGVACGDPDVSLDDNCIEADIGKNQWYISFALGTPQTSESEDEIGMVDNLVAQQNMYNAPEVNWITGTFYPPMSTEDMWNFGDLNYAIFNTEIARRASLMSQSLAKAATGSNGLVAMPLWKEGTINQGGPADIMARRIVYNQCPIPEEDEDGPIIEKVDWVQYLADGKNIKIKGEVSNLDDKDDTPEYKDTGYFIRDAVNTEYVFFVRNDAPKDWDNFLAENLDYPPCYIQASDEDPAVEGQPLGNWGPAFDLTEYWEEIGVDCECIIPPPAPATAELRVATMAVAPTVSLAAASTQSENPYDFSNMECAWYDGEGGKTEGTWLFDPETDFNPYYPKGLCTAPAINLSARTPYDCEVTGGSDGVCPGAADMTCTDDEAFGQLCASTTDPEDNQLLDKLITWYQCPGSTGSSVGSDELNATSPACYTEPDSALLMANVDDRSWYNPIEISKAHRGFLDGDFVFMLYAWSPNWKLNAVGRDRYELYTRRSFDGGVSWTTTPDSFTASNGVNYSGQGTTTCETWRDGEDSATDSHVCTAYEAGAPEQSRNVSQHKSMLITTLDPRYTPTAAEMPDTAPEGIVWGIFEPIDPTDFRDPSRNFVVFESGDNTTTSVGEAEPLNLDYGRAEMFGDYFTVWAETDTGTADLSLCYPNDAHGTTDVDWAVGTGFCNEFDSLEGFPLSVSEEASIISSAYGDFLYGVWGQFNLDAAGEFVDGDAMFRRVWYIDDYISPDEAWTLPGASQ